MEERITREEAVKKLTARRKEIQQGRDSYYLQNNVEFANKVVDSISSRYGRTVTVSLINTDSGEASICDEKVETKPGVTKEEVIRLLRDSGFTVEEDKQNNKMFGASL